LLWPSLFLCASSAPVISPLSLHDALPIFLVQKPLGDQLAHRLLCQIGVDGAGAVAQQGGEVMDQAGFAALENKSHGGALFGADQDRKSTRLNSSHVSISYAVFCLKKKSNE